MPLCVPDYLMTFQRLIYNHSITSIILRGSVSLGKEDNVWSTWLFTLMSVSLDVKHSSRVCFRDGTQLLLTCVQLTLILWILTLHSINQSRAPSRRAVWAASRRPLPLTFREWSNELSVFTICERRRRTRFWRRVMIIGGVYSQVVTVLSPLWVEWKAFSKKGHPPPSSGVCFLAVRLLIFKEHRLRMTVVDFRKEKLSLLGAAADTYIPLLYVHRAPKCGGISQCSHLHIYNVAGFLGLIFVHELLLFLRVGSWCAGRRWEEEDLLQQYWECLMLTRVPSTLFRRKHCCQRRSWLGANDEGATPFHTREESACPSYISMHVVYLHRCS